MITSAVVFIVHPVCFCCLINQDEGGWVVGGLTLKRERVVVVVVYRRLFVNRVPPLALEDV